MPTLDMIQKKYDFNIDDISDLIFIWAKSKDKRDFIRRFVDEFDVQKGGVFSPRDLDSLYKELSESDEVKCIVQEGRKNALRESLRRNKKRTITESFGTKNFKEGDSVIIVDRNDAGLSLGEVVKVSGVDGNYVLITKGKRTFGIPMRCVKSMVEESNIKKDSKLLNKTMTRKYVDMIKEGKSHKDVLEKIAQSYGMTVLQVEDKINDCLNLAGRDRFRKMDEECGKKEEPKTIKEEEEFPEEAAYNEEYEEIADRVLVYLLRNSEDYKNLYESIDEAVDAVLTFLKLKDKVGTVGTEKIVEIIKDKYTDTMLNSDDSDFADDETEVNEIEESRINRDIVESVKRTFGSPSYWATTKEHFIAGFTDRVLTSESLNEIGKLSSFECLKENSNFSMLYFKK